MKFHIKQHKNQKHYFSAFTLIELLVLIAIIAILAAILFPVFGRARENARKSSCASNMKQMALGVAQYTQDYDEFMPFRGNSASKISWRTFIMPYVKSSQIFACPSNPNRDKNNSSDIDPSIDRLPVSYGANPNVMVSSSSPPVALASLQQPAEIILIAESVGGNSEVLLNQTLATMIARTNGPFAGHMNMANFQFADGHVKAIRPSRTVTGAVFTSPSDNFWSTGKRTVTNNMADYLTEFHNKSTTDYQTLYKAKMAEIESAYE